MYDYDVAVIGAGINGCSIAYELSKEGYNVALFDKEGVAQGGSGAAGAFISPKFSKAGELKEVINEAFLYSMQYYDDNFPNHFTKAQLLHIAKDFDEEEVLRVFKQSTPLELKTVSDTVYESLTDEARKCEYISIDAGIVDAFAMCQAMSQHTTLIELRVESLEHQEDHWMINDTYKVKKVILTTGAYKSIVDEPYIQLRGVWGHRIDIKTSLQNPYSIHQFVSISPTKEGIVAIGATHNVHYHPDINTEEYDFQEGREELLQKARKTIRLDDVEVVKDYTGLRSGSFDYMPLVGPLVKSEETLACCQKQLRVRKPDFDNFVLYKDLYMMNGSGGYGFVLAPYLAKILKENIVHDKEISQRLQPARFFARWAKRR